MTVDVFSWLGEWIRKVLSHDPEIIESAISLGQQRMRD